MNPSRIIVISVFPDDLIEVRVVNQPLVDITVCDTIIENISVDIDRLTLAML
jgi:hypothetical protein